MDDKTFLKEIKDVVSRHFGDESVTAESVMVANNVLLATLANVHWNGIRGMTDNKDEAEIGALEISNLIKDFMLEVLMQCVEKNYNN